MLWIWVVWICENSYFAPPKRYHFLKTLVIICVMSAQEWAGFILTLLSIGGVTLSAIRWYIKVQIKPVEDNIISLKKVVEEVRAETKTNGGSSMRDEIKAIKLEQEHAREKRNKQTEKIDHLYDLFVDYLAKNSK